MKYLIVPRAMRPTMKLTAADLDRLLKDKDNEPPTVRRPDLALAWARSMNALPEAEAIKLIDGH